MLSANNILSPAHGRPITVPTQDMVIGVYYLTARSTTHRQRSRGSSLDRPRHEARAGLRRRGDDRPRCTPRSRSACRRATRRTTAARRADSIVLRAQRRDGRARSCSRRRSAGPLQRGAARRTTRSSTTSRQEATSTDRRASSSSSTRQADVAASLDALKDARLPLRHPVRRHDLHRRRRHARRKAEILEKLEAEADKVESQYERGLITDDERRQKVDRDLDARPPTRSRDAMQDELRSTKFNPIYMMVDSGARGNIMQVQPDRRHARSRGQPEGRDHPAADQVELPRGPLRPRVLHLHARRPQGSGRHRAAHRRLRATSRVASSTWRRTSSCARTTAAPTAGI